MEVPEKFSKQLKNLVNTFIWSTKRGQTTETRTSTHTQLCLMSQQPNHGGCKFLELDKQINAFATKWLQRLLDPTPSPWKDFVWHKIDKILENDPIAQLPREFIFIGNIPPRIQKKLKWKMTGIWRNAFSTFFSSPHTPTPIDKRNIYDLKSTYIYYNNDLKRKNNMTLEPNMIPDMATIEDIWDEEENDIISKDKLLHIFPLIPKRKITAFNKTLLTFKDKITKLIREASQELPLPLIIKHLNKHYLLDSKNRIFTGTLDPHTQAFTTKNETQRLLITITISI